MIVVKALFEDQWGIGGRLVCHFSSARSALKCGENFRTYPVEVGFPVANRCASFDGEDSNGFRTKARDYYSRGKKGRYQPF